MVSQYLAKCDNHRHCCSEDMTILVVEGQDSTCLCFNRNYCLFLKYMTWHAHTQNFRTKTDSQCVQWRTADLCYTCLPKKLAEITLRTFAILSRTGSEKEKEKEKLEWKQQKFSRFTKTQKINFSFFFHYTIQHDEDFGHTFSNKLFAWIDVFKIVTFLYTTWHFNVILIKGSRFWKVLWPFFKIVTCP